MKRRDFLKLMAVAIAAPSTLVGAVKAKPEQQTAFPSHPGCINPAFTGGIGKWDDVIIIESFPSISELAEWLAKPMDKELVAALCGLSPARFE